MEACPGARVWVPQDSGWAEAVVISCNGSRLRVKCQADGAELELDGSQAHLCNGDEVEDMTTLAFLHEPGVLWNLQSRYRKTEIYTYTGIILIAVNPFKPVPHLYGPGVIERYRWAPRDQMPPHVYATACAAYSNMMRDGTGQAILVTGESGAGKTETAKLIMACLTHLGSSRRSSGGAGKPQAMSGVEQKILESNPLLEAFGNAKTLRNNNSSRFGKYVEIFFDPAAGGAVTGAAVRTYLLERSRVVAVNDPERSFHIFYQLVDGASPDDRRAWRLPATAAGFAYLARSSCFELPGQSNVEEYQHTRRAMSHMGLSEEQQSSVLATVAGVLHLGNIVFVDGERAGPDGGEGAVVAPGGAQQALAAAAELLGVDPERLAETLTTRQIQTPEGPIATPLSAQAAADARDSMAKEVYSRLFDWLVAAINAAVHEAHTGGSEGGSEGPQSHHTSIGLLDIYGFESFQVNDLEQLCINLTNEKLQQHFNQHVFKWEQAEYEREGVNWSYIDFQDNADVLDLLEGRMGIMDLLDETCRFPKATADDLAHKYGTTTAVSGSNRFTRLKRPATSFVVNHYAGSVTYSTLNFLDKNRDYVVAEHQSLLGSSSRPILQDLFCEGPAAPGSAASLSSAGGAPAAADSNGNGGTSLGGSGPSRSQFQFRSVSSQCRRQLSELMAALASLQPHYVRCIKPNPGNAPGHFDPGYSLQQLRCGGVMEAVRIACAGYSYRRPYSAFLDHYWQLCPGPVHDLRRRLADRFQSRPRCEAAPGDCSTSSVGLGALDVAELRPVAEAVLASVWASSGAQQPVQGSGSPPAPPPSHLGHTKVFLRATAAAALERERLAVVGAAAAIIQAHFRRLQVERWYQSVRQAIITIQAHCRGLLARREAQRLQRERAATAIQRAWRGCVARLRFQRLRSATVVLQAAWRGVLVRRALEALRLERAAVVVQTSWRAAVVRREYLGVLRYWRAAVKVQAAWRGYAARQLYLQILPLHRTALTLQRIWRSHRAGAQLADRLRTALLQYWVYSKAAVVIQAGWRGRVARKRAAELRRRQRRARFLAAHSCFAAEAAAGPARFSPEGVRRGPLQTPPAGPRTLSHTLGGSAGKGVGGSALGLGSARSADTTPITGEVVRGDDVAAMRDRDVVMRKRLAELQDFKLSPLVQYWQHKEAAAVDSRTGSITAPAKGPSALSHSGPASADPKRRYSLGATSHASPVRYTNSPYGAHSPARSLGSPPDTDDRFGRTQSHGTRRVGGHRGRSSAASILDAAELVAAGRGASSSTLASTLGGVATTEEGDFSSRGGSATTVDDGPERLSSGGLSCEPSYGQLLCGMRQEEGEGAPGEQQRGSGGGGQHRPMAVHA